MSMLRGNQRGMRGFAYKRGRGRGTSLPAARGRGHGREQGGGQGSSTGGSTNHHADGAELRDDTLRDAARAKDIDAALGFSQLPEGLSREGWLINMHETMLYTEDSPRGLSAVDYYFIQDDGSMFKTTAPFEPYFLVSTKSRTESIVEAYLMKQYDGVLSRIAHVEKVDLNEPNHLLGNPRPYLQLRFQNVNDLLTVRKDLLKLNLKSSQTTDAYAEIVNAAARMHVSVEDDPWGTRAELPIAQEHIAEPWKLITDIREYDLPYYLRVAIDNGVRVGFWYSVKTSPGDVTLSLIENRVKRAEPVVMAYDIEVTKLPLKFPDRDVDQIMMISYMIDGQGFLITNREIVSEDIGDFDYTPKPEYEGPFTVFNEPGEEAVLRRWFEHIRESKPTVMATYNGDAFDFPFIETRARFNGLDMYQETGFKRDSEDEFKSRTCIHMDCFRWVKRDSYLPQGSQGLKAVTSDKLGYAPRELDPELMTPYARDEPQSLAQYSVSDAVATYYLYMKYVHPFIFSLCNIIPLKPDEVLRKGTGTLCETLLMVEAYRSRVIMPNRHEESDKGILDGHLLVSETYVGGHVEASEAGVFRSDIATNFNVQPWVVQGLIDDLDSTLEFCIAKESKTPPGNVTNYDEVKDKITAALEELRDSPHRTENPRIYHLDVAAMYPNIILSNRLQPDSVVDERTCAVCEYNRPDETCIRRMAWAWRGEYFPAQKDEYNMIKHALQQETFPHGRPFGISTMTFDDLPRTEKAALMHKRLGDYSKKVYKKTTETKTLKKEAIICQRENSFYVDTVRSFRDRRYQHKATHKEWKTTLDAAMANEGDSMIDIEEAKKMVVLYDSLQLAHKCILNSFYGYVMRKGARWYSMEMAGVTCLTGAAIIKMASEVIKAIGRPLELDTDGIWCLLPDTFPTTFEFSVTDGKPVTFSYPCTMLNYRVHDKFTNDQYHNLVDPQTDTWDVHSENSIFFELDGPYRAMVIPSSKEEGKLLKKRYAVFNDDGSLAELKGFEVKRRGELALIKIFQSQVFEKFLLGTTTEECYAAVAAVADRWLDVLFTKASSLDDGELLGLIAENRTMSKTLAEYGGQKSTSISTAKRLAEFLGDQMVENSGLACRFIISAQPFGASIAERAIPVAIFAANEEVQRKYLQKWLKDDRLSRFDLRSILDWSYYVERLGSVVQKLITIPAALQQVPNPVPRIPHPNWLVRRIVKTNGLKQTKVTDFFSPVEDDTQVGTQDVHMVDVEDIGQASTSGAYQITVGTKNGRSSRSEAVDVVALAKDHTADFPGFVAAAKPRWQQRWDLSMKALPGEKIPNMFVGTRVKVTTAWDIVQIRSTQSLGKYVMWTYEDSTLVPITLRIPREFYVNMETEPNEATFDASYSAVPVVRTLPRGHPSLHLYKITVSERTYLGSESHFADLLHHPNVQGVYELQVPLVIRAILRVGTRGSIVDPSSMTFGKAKSDGFELAQLERAPSPLHQHTYLDGGSSMKYILLFHSSTHPRHIFAVFHPSGTLKVHLVDLITRRRSLPRIAEIYDSLLRARSDAHSVFSYPETIQPDVTHHSSEASALKGVSKELEDLKIRNAVLVISSSKEKSWFEEMVPRVDRFPLLLWQGRKEYHTLDTWPWETAAVQKMVTRFLGMGLWLFRTIHEAAAYDIPVGNIEGDEPLYFTDIDFARRLIQKDMIIWWSSSGTPDLGGREDGRYASDEMSNVEINTPGCYNNVSISVQVHNLAINAVARSSMLDVLKGGDGPTFEFTFTPDGLEDVVASPQTFGVLKEMVKSWLDRTDGSVHLGAPHFWRWLSTGASQMFDPGLQRLVYRLMREIFLHMLAEFKRLGSFVIAADFSHVLLLTPKSPGTAAAYATYLITAVKSHELFKGINLETERYYDFLLYMDSANLGGVSCEDPRAVVPPSILPIFMHWNIATFLPRSIQHMFNHVVKAVIVKIFRTMLERRTSSRAPTRSVQNLDTSRSDAIGVNEAKENEDDVLRTFVSKQLTRKLLRDVTEINGMLEEASTAEEFPDGLLFPLLPGTRSPFTMDDPTLEYIKFTCAVFALLKDLSVEIEVLRKNLLAHIGVKAFSEVAAFRNPCEPFKLPMVVCHICSAVRDFDFCRDPDLFSDDPNGGTAARWECSVCECEYDRKSIEAMLIDVGRKLLTGFQLQDLRCTRCRQIRSDNLSLSCKCGGTFEYTLPKDEAKRKVRTLYNVAAFHGLPLVKTYAQYLLDNW